jgi:isoprenylcysteine carboxyl methyltransferase (ICMT) family protein YpbQ
VSEIEKKLIVIRAGMFRAGQMMMARGLLFTGIYHFKMSHHTRFMMLKNMTVVHPFPRPVIGHPRYFYFASGSQIDRILPH